MGYKLLEKKLNDQYKILNNVLSEGGAVLNVNEVKDVTNILFEFSNGKYDGSDSLKPSEFLEFYPDYLEAQEKNLISKKNPPGTRILINKEDELKKDFFENKDKVARFLTWHIKNQVVLKIAKPSNASKISKDILKLNVDITDVGVWPDYALLYKPLKNEEKIHLYMKLPDDNEYKNIASYFKELNNPKNSEELDIGKFGDFIREGVTRSTDGLIGGLETTSKLFEKNLAQMWEDFVFCDKRLKKNGEETLFLDNLYNQFKDSNNIIIFDAALGTGCESIYFLKKGIDVRSNEIDDNLQLIAYKNAKNEGVYERLILSSWNWVDLDKNFNKRYPNTKVNIVLLLGNSLCLVLNKNDRITSLRSFYNIIKPGGMLVIDERNFDYILKNKSIILKDPIKNFRFKGEYVYCGECVKGVPTKINEDIVEFSYYEIPQNTRKEIDSYQFINEHIIGRLLMYPFKNGELCNLLEEVGFENIEKYSDFKKGYDPNADFYTYIAQKPQNSQSKNKNL